MLYRFCIIQFSSLEAIMNSGINKAQQLNAFGEKNLNYIPQK